MASQVDNMELEECISGGLKEDIETKQSRVPQYLATVIVDLLHLSYGLAIGWPATALPLLQSENTPLSGGPITMEEASWLAAIFYFIAAPSMPVYGYLCERFGRKTCYYVVGIPYVISAALLILATNMEMVYAAKIFLGLSAGGIFVLCPLYVSEIAEAKIRGSLGVFLTLMRNIGILIANIVGTYFSFRTVAWVSLAPPVVFLLCLAWLPETPIFLLRRGKPEEATRALQWFRGKGSNVDQEMDNMKASLKAMSSEGSASASFSDLFATKGTIKAVIIGVILCFNQQLSGFFGIITYTVMIFEESGSTMSPNTSSIIISVMLICATILATVLCDRTGRKVLLLLSNIFMIITLTILGFYFYLKEQGVAVSSFGWIPVSSLSVYVISYCIGLAAMPIVIMTEIFSPKLRNMAISANGVLVWFVIFAVTKFFPMFSDTLGLHGACWVFSGCCALGAGLLTALLPETKNRSLESILLELEGKDSSTKPSEKKHEECSFISSSKTSCDKNESNT